MGLNSCGAGCFWISQIIILFLIVAFSVWVRWGVLKRLKDGGPVLSEIEWDEKNTIIYPLLAIVAGLVAGMFGIGGGIIKGPLMLALGKWRTTRQAQICLVELPVSFAHLFSGHRIICLVLLYYCQGVHPAVASATSACMILFTSCTSTVSFMIFGLLVYDYAWFCLLVGFFSTLVGQTVMTILMQRYQRNSYIAYSIGFVVGLSAIAMSIESVLAIVKGQR